LFCLAIYVPVLLFFDRRFVQRAVLRTRRHFGLCPQCGYDLRATPERCLILGGKMAVNCRGVMTRFDLEASRLA
jgi:hypothetical protein